MTDTLPFHVDTAPVAAFCRSHGIVRLAIFGSALRSAFPPSSDVDVLVEFAPGQTPGFAFFAMQDDLSQLFGRRVDLQTPALLSKYFRDEVRAQARVLYAPDQVRLRHVLEAARKVADFTRRILPA